MPDVTIIGGGPAGCTVATLLARGGWAVTLVEQSRFPRDKVCGECLSALGFDVLTRLGLSREFVALGAVRLDRCEIHPPGRRSLNVELPRPMWGLSRRALDGLLLAAARDAGATIRQPVRCERLEAAPAGGSRLRMRDLTTNAVETACPGHVILADGKAAFADDAPAPSGDFGIKTHFADVDGPRDRIELFGVRGSYGGLAAIEAGRWNAAFSVPAGRLKAARGDLDRLFAELTAESATLRRRLAGARRVVPWLASPLPRFSVREQWHPNVIPVGNAAAALEPIGGEGMGLAMRSAELAASSLIHGGRGDAALDQERTLASAYRSLWRTRRPACRAAAVAVSTPMAGALLAVTPPPGPLLRGALRLMGKTSAADGG